METMKFGVQGMTCNGCVASVTRVLASLPGVDKVEVTLQPGSATVQFDPTRINASSMKSAVEDAGFEISA